MWAEALAEKERTKDGGSREAESGENEGKKKKKEAHNSDEATFFSRWFGCNAGITEPL